MCQVCMEYIDDGEDAGFPRTCAGCQREGAWKDGSLSKGKSKVTEKPQAVYAVRFHCLGPGCKRSFTTVEGVSDHWRHKHV